MSRVVREVANAELFWVGPTESAPDVQAILIALGVSTCPVIGTGRKLLGVVGLRDVHGLPTTCTVADVMSAPAATIEPEATLEEAAEAMVESATTI